MYRHGLLEIGEELARVILIYLIPMNYSSKNNELQESGLEIQENSTQPFVVLNEILEKLKQKNLGPALKWAEAHREALLERSSSLEFKLHRLHFLNLVSEGPEKQSEAITYVRKHFPPYVNQHETGKTHFNDGNDVANYFFYS